MSRTGSSPYFSGRRRATRSTTVSVMTLGSSAGTNQKTDSSPLTGSDGISSPLISCTARTMREATAWRKTSVSHTTGTAPESIKSVRTAPARLMGAG